MNLKNYCIPRKQTTMQPLNNFEPKKPWKYKQFWGLRPDPSCLGKKVSVRKIKAELLTQYVTSLKKVVCKDRASRNGMQ